MNSNNKIALAFTAHPDDAELSLSGTLKLLIDRGWSVLVCPMTAGGMGGMGEGEAVTAQKRLAEAKKAAGILGADFYCLGGRDGFLYDNSELRLAAISLIRKTRPALVISHLPDDYHPDHRACCQIAEAATLLSTLANVPTEERALNSTPALYHSAPLGLGDPLGNAMPSPSFMIDISGLKAFKEQLLACHKSQIEVMRVMHGMSDFALAMHRQDEHWGRLAGLVAAEAFWQHLGGGFPKTPVLQEALADYVRQPVS